MAKTNSLATIERIKREAIAAAKPEIDKMMEEAKKAVKISPPQPDVVLPLGPPPKPPKVARTSKREAATPGGKLLMKICEKYKLSLPQLAEQLGKKPSYIASSIWVRKEPSPACLAWLQSALDKGPKNAATYNGERDAKDVAKAKGKK